LKIEFCYIYIIVYEAVWGKLHHGFLLILKLWISRGLLFLKDYVIFLDKYKVGWSKFLRQFLAGIGGGRNEKVSSY